MDAWELTKKLVKIDSTDPGNYEMEIGEFIFNLIKTKLDELKLNYKICLEDENKNLKCDKNTIYIFKRKAVGERFNLMFKIIGCSENEQELSYICHMDTVQIGDGWDEETSPFSAKEVCEKRTLECGNIIDDTKLFGRGSCDMKSGLAVALSSFLTVLNDISKKNKFPQNNFKLLLTVDEENEMVGIEKMIEWGWVTSSDLCLDTEPTDNMIQIAHKGRTWFKLTINSQTAHASKPWMGIDANAVASEIVSYIRKEVDSLPVDEELGISTVTFGMQNGGYSPYVVPDKCVIYMDFRLTPPTETKDIKKIIDDAIINAKHEIARSNLYEYRFKELEKSKEHNVAILNYIEDNLNVDILCTGDRPYIKRYDDSILQKTLKKVIFNVTKVEAKVSYFTGYTDTAVVAGKLKNKNCMSYGPGSLSMAHKPNEYVYKSDIDRCVRVLKELALEYLEVKK